MFLSHTRPNNIKPIARRGAMLLSAKTKAAHITGLEIQEESAEMAERSLKLNSDILNGRLDIVRGDIKEAGKLFAPASFEVICCNPPYKKAGSGIINPHDAKAVARHEICVQIQAVF